MTTLILGTGAASSAWLQTLGRFHVAIVHFPIALLLLAGAIELWRSVRRSNAASPTAIACLVTGALTAILSAWMGWVHKGFSSIGGEHATTLFIHQWLGIAGALFAVGALLTLASSRKHPERLWVYRTVTIVCALLIAITGHFGGTLTHGDGYLTELIFAPKTESTNPQLVSAPVMPTAFPADGKIHFTRDVQPILVEACLDCHGPAKHRAGLRLDTREVALKGGAKGPALVPGKSDDSLLMKHILALDGKKRMPMGKDPLPDVQVKILKAWIDQGATWSSGSESIAKSDQKKHWAYVKPVRPELPAVNDRDWPKNDIDYFVLARLEKEGMKPSPEADRATLIRRLSLDLLGLPPSPEEVDAFVNDTDPHAYDNLVNRMLSSPHYGERWGRHWLDLARYADTNGYEKDQPRVIWPYRDWVINALNRDMTFDQFVIDQIAGDMLPNASPEEKIATGFHRNTMFNEEGGIDAEEFRFKAVVDRVQTTSTALLGLTMHCAQCHNHKYDDISQKEYYQFFSLLNNADEPYMNIPDAKITEQRRAAQEKIDTLTRELASKFPARDDATKYEVLSPDIFATTDKGSRLVLQPDNVLLAAGKVPVKDTYVIEADVNLDGVTSFRLEALTDPSLPNKGPGREGSNAKNGNFVLSQFKVQYRDIADENATATPPTTRIKIDRAEADYNQPEFDVSKSIDDYFQKGWAVGGAEGKPHTATFYTPDKLSGRKTVVITLKQLFSQHTLGKFRLSVGRAPAAPTTQPTPADREKFLVTKMDEWEKSLAPKCAKWEVLDPAKYSRFHDATITKLDDNSLLYTGDNFYREEYKIQAHTGAKNITAIRVEVLPHEAQPKGGPGRNPNGGFLLSEITAVASSTTQPATTQPVNFASASADVANDSAPRAIDGKKDTHWTVPTGGAKPVEAVFKLKDKLPGFDGGTMLDVALAQNYFQSENMGRVRISVTSDPNAGEAPGVPADVEAILLTPQKDRMPEQIARLRDQFLITTPYLAVQQQEIAQVKSSVPSYVTTLVMQERMVPRVTKIHHRGEYLQPTDPVEPGVPAILPPLPKGATPNRLTLARWLVDENNPLVARVVMNRVWNVYFGRGIVNTIEDFGIMGERPSHPELLDYLATEFQRQHWSMKAMHRLIVTSATYRQSSRMTPELLKRDPQNVLLARGPRFRVESEIVRDIALAASGLLNEQVGGPSVFPPQPPGISDLSYGPLKWVDSVGPERYRRGMYTFMKRTAMYPFQVTFDGPSADSTCPRRIRSDTPLQALTTLNDTVFVEAAQALAKRVTETGPTDVAGRAAQVFRLCVARQPNDKELKMITDFYSAQLKRLEDKQLDAKKLAMADSHKSGKDAIELAAWTTVARTILNLDETVTKE